MRIPPEQIAGADLPLLLGGGTDGECENSRHGTRVSGGLTGPLERHQMPVALRGCLAIEFGKCQPGLDSVDNPPEADRVTHSARTLKSVIIRNPTDKLRI